MTYDKQFVRDVGHEVDRRRRGRRRLLILLWLLIILAALVYLRCGQGWGIGIGSGTGTGSGAATALPTQVVRCVVRISAEGIAVDGKLMKAHEAVTACKKTDGALVTVTGDARQGDWDELRVAFEAARVKIFTREQ